MRAAVRLYAQITRTPRFLEPGAPTGLTGIFNHPSPRSTLLYLYNATLEKLKALPESSVYRQSTEALTNHRLKIVEPVKPEGLDAWMEKVKKIKADNPNWFGQQGGGALVVVNGREFVRTDPQKEYDEREVEWDGEALEAPALEGPRTAYERRNQAKELGAGRSPDEDALKAVPWDPEPPLSADQIADIERQIGAGLIEEVIMVAEGELQLVDTMRDAKVWEELEEKPPEGQWAYYERGTHQMQTQTPSK